MIATFILGLAIIIAIGTTLTALHDIGARRDWWRS